MNKQLYKHKRQFKSTPGFLTIVFVDLLRLSGETDAGVLEAEERPRLGLQTVSVEARQRDIGAL